MRKTSDAIACADDIHSRLKGVAVFLSRYAALLLSCGTTTIRMEKNVGRIAAVYDTTAEVTVFPMHIMMTVWDTGHSHSYSNSVRVGGSGPDFALNSGLSALSWRISDRRLPLPVAERMMRMLSGRPRLYGWLVLLLTGIANASFCRLFGGDAMSMLIVFVATVDGFYIKNRLHRSMHCDIRIATIVAGCFSAIIASAGFAFGLGDTPDVALATSVLYLVPGIPYINAVSDLLHGHYICSFSRMVTAIVLTVCLSIGLCLAIILMDVRFF